MTSMHWNRQLFCAAVAAIAAFPVTAAGPTLDQTLAKMDQVSSRFKGLSAKVEYMQHMEAIHEDDSQTGTILVKRANRQDLHVKTSIEKPEPKVAVADGKKVEVYYPSSGEEQTVSLGAKRSFVSMILTLGFGGSSKELQSAYDVKLGGADTVAGESATRLELVPKSKEMRDQWIKIDLWISDRTGYAVQQKFYERGKDYTQITYTGVQPRSDIPDTEFSLPKGVPKQPLNKKK
jgi:outer membrane lipoprotein-sorting protein